MISYNSDPSDVWNLVDNLGRVFADPISRSGLILEEAHNLYESLFSEFRQTIAALRQINTYVRFREFGSNPDRIVLILAARYGYLDIVRYLRDGSLGKVYPWSVEVIARAVEHGHMEVVRALRDRSLGEVCPWDESVPVFAAVTGRLNILRALRDGSLGDVCPWDKEECRRWARKQPKILELIDSGVLD